ncbi:MAG: SAM-dependent methyltransferase, partial [Halobacteriota archaeon]
TFECVDEGGAWVAIAPADPRTSIQLYDVERTLVPPATAYAPMLRLWPDRQPTDACWSFVERPVTEVPPFQRRLQREAKPADRERYVTRSIRYSYTILRRDGHRRFDVRGDPARFIPLGDVGRAIGDRVDVITVKLSGDLAPPQGNSLVRVGDGSQRDDCFAVCVRPTALNRGLIEAPYGSIMTIDGALVLWNDDESAINLVIDEESIVERRSG